MEKEKMENSREVNNESNIILVTISVWQWGTSILPGRYKSQEFDTIFKQCHWDNLKKKFLNKNICATDGSQPDKHGTEKQHRYHYQPLLLFPVPAMKSSHA